MNAFEKLAPFIQDYIYRNNWEELREVQVAACDVILHTDNNLLIATPTASGKTEAAFLPVITELYHKPSSSVGVLYIAPLKALINDQFVRIEELLEEAYIPVTKWHGDASQSLKNKLLKNPKGIMQTTPESLEAMLMKRKQQAMKLFSDLRFIIIDEVHHFIGEDRGVQLLSLLERLQNLIGFSPRRIGLSATLGDGPAAEQWLNSGTPRTCVTPDVGTERRKAMIMISHFYTLPGSVDQERQSALGFFESLYSLTRGKKSIVFSNSRSDVERNMVNLKDIAEKRREPDVFLVHHGSISASNREYAETQMKFSDLPLVTGATVTLELGIDLGDLERIVQTGCPHSVASLAQRLGRSGRRGGVSEMCFLFEEEKKSEGIEFYQAINWLFVKCIALIELYRENWLEPIAADRYPYGVLYHQTMSFLYSHGEAKPELLAQSILSEAVFADVSQEDYKILLRDMLEKEQLERTSSGGLLVGAKGEILTNHYHFYSVFESPAEYSVRDGSQEIGTLSKPLPPDTTFVLSGKTWSVVEVDQEQKIIDVTSAKGKPPTVWDGTGGGFEHTRVLQKMREVIAGPTEYPYLHPSAASRLNEIRLTIRQTRLLENPVFEISPDTFGLALWLGTKAANALDLALTVLLPQRQYTPPYWPFLIVKNVGRDALLQALEHIKTVPLSISDLRIPDGIKVEGKYNDFVPPELLRKQYAAKTIDIAEMQREMTKNKEE
ncbi:DEAD/DEAH box helicase domain protein [Syntrophobotulus glycolicus DSM 8271]|uniref:DEAD/DEAH box helicase domain protein n=1 Tax=Syntrophobotulus glycolicus (strain DSM 8271 / FlGlyR) TaxID=645991 RepID=F0T1V8_SYNGF|nr:DEAD/DEAH box helicase [Syntrophobotulus glycolicus]ADY55222.1 DEAD/DEAH box helicase domain protein [Syntrophobotulus glycolicus DSM 8271]